MFRKQHHRKANPIFILFRLILSLVMFVVLLGGVYSAYKHFSGFDPLKLDPQAVLRSALSARTPKQLLTILSSVKLTQGLSSTINQKVLGQTKSSYSFKFLLIADSHNDSPNLQKAISQAKSANPDLAFIIGLGDYTNVGTIDELRNTKKEFDTAGLRYFLVSGDHDLWDSRNQKLPADANFKQVFGPTYQAFTYQNFSFLLLDDSDDYLGFGNIQLDWVSSELEKSKAEGIKGIFVFLHEPLYHPSSDHFMGKLESSLKQQAQSMIFQLKQSNVKKVFAGDIHFFSEYEEPTTKLPMVTVGAVVTDRNPQAPRYAVVTVYGDGSTKVDDLPIK